MILTHEWLPTNKTKKGSGDVIINNFLKKKFSNTSRCITCEVEWRGENHFSKNFKIVENMICDIGHTTCNCDNSSKAYRPQTVQCQCIKIHIDKYEIIFKWKKSGSISFSIALQFWSFSNQNWNVLVAPSIRSSDVVANNNNKLCSLVVYGWHTAWKQ